MDKRTKDLRAARDIILALQGAPFNALTDADLERVDDLLQERIGRGLHEMALQMEAQGFPPMTPEALVAGIVGAGEAILAANLAANLAATDLEN